MLEKGFKRLNSKYLLKYLLGDRLETDRDALLESFKFLSGLDVINSYFVDSMDQLYYESLIIDGQGKLIGGKTTFNFFNGLIQVKAAGPIF